MRKRKLTKAERDELNALLERMEANSRWLRELAERAQAKLDAQKQQ
jgi:hypothetical protein